MLNYQRVLHGNGDIASNTASNVGKSRSISRCFQGYRLSLVRFGVVAHQTVPSEFFFMSSWDWFAQQDATGNSAREVIGAEFPEVHLGSCAYDMAWSCTPDVNVIWKGIPKCSFDALEEYVGLHKVKPIEQECLATTSIRLNFLTYMFL